jgi:Tol biopolymer transport system component
MALAPGTRLGPYEVLAPLGAGGMGEVYKARDTRLDRTVAIKVLPESLSATPELRARFEREARAVSSLNHPHICTLYDIGREQGVDYLVMEHIEGETLAARLEKGPLSTPEVLRHAAEIADALDKAHRQGMVHRDLKPGNVMLTKSGAKLLDFGLARVIAPAVPGSGSGSLPMMLSQTPTVATPLTGAGMLVGTFQYMSPEQLEGQEADARSDIWAFGATVYEMATGKKAFEGHSQASLIASILREQPRPIAELQPLTPPGLDRVVQRCLAKDPDDRWQSARDLAHELKWIADAGTKAGVPAPVAARRRRLGQLSTVVAAASTLGMIAFAVGFVLRAPAKPEVVRFEIRPPSAIQFQDAPRLSPDGHILAYSATDSTGTSRIWIRPLSAMVAQPLGGTEGVFQRPFWSPDSRYLGFFAGGKLKKIEISGGPPITICDAATGSDGTWSRLGVILYDGGTSDPIKRVSASGGVPVPAALPDTARHLGVGWPTFLPDGRHFVYMVIGDKSGLRIGKLDSKEFKDICPADSRAEFAPPGYLLFLRGGSLVAQPFDERALKLKGEPFPVAEPVRGSPNGGGDFSVSRDGALVYAAGAGQRGRLVWAGRDGKLQEIEGTTNIPTLLNLALSPDTRRVAVRVMDPQVRTRDIWLVDLARGVTSRFTFEPSNQNHPLWAADGSRVLYFSDASEARGIHLKSASGAGGDELLLKSNEDLVPTDWSRDGRYVIYEMAKATGNNEVWALPTFGERKPFPFLQAQFNQFGGRLSPDGRWLAYASDESGRPEVYVQTFPEHGGKWQISTNGGMDPRWRGDGKELFYLSADQRLMTVSIVTTPAFEADVPKPLFPVQVMFPGLGLRTHYDVTADGQRFLLVSPLGSETLAGTQVVLNWTAEARRK